MKSDSQLYEGGGANLAALPSAMRLDSSMTINRLTVPATFLFLGVFALSENATLDDIDVFVAADGGYHTYRIPSLIETKKGALLAFCEGRRTHKRYR